MRSPARRNSWAGRAARGLLTLGFGAAAFLAFLATWWSAPSCVASDGSSLLIKPRAQQMPLQEC